MILHGIGGVSARKSVVAVLLGAPIDASMFDEGGFFNGNK